MTIKTKNRIVKIITIIITVYVFLLSIKLMGHSFKLFGKDFAEAMLVMTSNPFAGLIIGIVATSLIQSSSTTTSLVVGLVAGGAVTLENAIPIIMGANIGTTITNTLVSFGHISNRGEFKKAFAAGIVHDFFNVCSVLVLFPLELKYHFIQKTAIIFESKFSSVGGVSMFNPLKAILDPTIMFINYLISFLPYSSVLLLVFSVFALFTSLIYLIRTIRSLVLNKIEIIINDYLFKNDFFGMFWGMVITFIVQSSSVTTSLVVPLAGAGVIKLKQIFPYSLGANVGTTGTAILAALATQNPVAITVAFAHLSFNLFGIAIFYPLKIIPIKLAEFVSEKASKSKKNLMLFILFYMSAYFLPIVFIFIF